MRPLRLQPYVFVLFCIVAMPAAFSVFAAGNHKLLIQVGSDDERTQEIALNNIVNLLSDMDNDIQIELVAYGPGVTMLAADNPLASRVANLSLRHNVTFSVCGSTLAKLGKSTGKDLVPTKGVRIVPTGLGRIIELRRGGWAQVRP